MVLVCDNPIFQFFYKKFFLGFGVTLFACAPLGERTEQVRTLTNVYLPTAPRRKHHSHQHSHTVLGRRRSRRTLREWILGMMRVGEVTTTFVVDLVNRQQRTAVIPSLYRNDTTVETLNRICAVTGNDFPISGDAPLRSAARHAAVARRQERQARKRFHLEPTPENLTAWADANERVQ